MAEETKGALKSAGIWGGLLGLGASLVQLFPQIGDTITAAVGSGLLGPHAAAIVSLAGSLLSIWGRKKATAQIKGLL